MILALVAFLAAGSGYDVASTASPKTALLAADEAAWRPARVIQWGPEKYQTRFRALWNADGIYLRFDSRDPQPWHTMKRRDDHLWEEEVVEIFLDVTGSGTNYAEYEINPANVICDVRMESPSPEKKLHLDWDHAGLESRVKQNSDGWTATLFLPWAGFRSLSPEAARVTLPPRPDTSWRFNVFRIERPGGPAAPRKGAVSVAWSDPGQPSFHVPAAFRPFRFVK